MPGSKVEQRRQYLESVGLDSTLVDVWLRKWRNLYPNAAHKGAKCLLTFEQYIDLAIDAGITQPSQIDKTKGSYSLGRVGDIGNYEIGNCRFITVEQNLDERGLNGGDDAISQKLEGRVPLGIVKSFILVSPDGVEYRGTNMSEFCRQFGLRPNSVSALCLGKVQTYKGWTGRYS